MISEFIEQSLKRAKYRVLEDGTYFATVPRLRGVWGQGKTIEECRQDLHEVIEDWLLLKIHSHDSIPGFQFDVTPRSLAHA
ncbi:MAG: type II toxin-antitoxin system HicB family antitoxin [Minisyncoccota bacterium]